MNAPTANLSRIVTLALSLLAATQVRAIDAERVANSIVLTAIQAENLGIESTEVDLETFQTTVFAIGHLEESPSARSVLSSRVAGRAVEVHAFVGDSVSLGDTLVMIESLQPGDPPPRIPLEAVASGIVVESHIHLGQPVDPASKLLDIADFSTLWAVANVPGHAGAKIAVGSRAVLRIPSAAHAPLTVPVARFGTHADPTTGNTQAIFEIPNPEGTLVPGMRVEFSLVTAEREDVMAVPIACVQGTESAPLVYVRDFELPNVFVKAPVVVGERNATHVEIIRGLFPGDEVITHGAYSLNYAGGASGMTLKEVLDAAHGHEHNEDGSEITADQKAAKEAEKEAALVAAAPGGGKTFARHWLLVAYAAASTLALIISLQLLWSKSRHPGTSDSR